MSDKSQCMKPMHGGELTLFAGRKVCCSSYKLCRCCFADILQENTDDACDHHHCQ
jgi:hypothetical protein